MLENNRQNVTVQKAPNFSECEQCGRGDRVLQFSTCLEMSHHGATAMAIRDFTVCILCLEEETE